MRDLFRLSILTVLIVTACQLDDGEDRRRSWSEVQALKAAYLEAPPDQKTMAKQRWADEVRAFLVRWPDHPGAVKTWTTLQLDYAEQLEANGRYAEAESHYRDLAERFPDNQRASAGAVRVARRLSLTEADFRSLEPGMTRVEVTRRIGPPRPGWDRSETSSGGTFESWYYKGRDGHVRGVHFRDGILYGVDLP